MKKSIWLLGSLALAAAVPAAADRRELGATLGGRPSSSAQAPQPSSNGGQSGPREAGGFHVDHGPGGSAAQWNSGPVGRPSLRTQQSARPAWEGPAARPLREQNPPARVPGRGYFFPGAQGRGDFPRAQAVQVPRTYLRGRQARPEGIPAQGPDGRHLDARMLAPGQVGSPEVRSRFGQVLFQGQNDAARLVRAENRPGTYWHRGNGFDYCHYVDPTGLNWFGWYFNGDFLWTRFYGGNWWWFDPVFSRWCFWNDGGWWWQPPEGATLYAYDNGQYVPAGSAGAAVATPPSGQETVYRSPDGSREVRIVGPDQDAFLYDTSPAPSFNPVYLGSHVGQVRFTDPNQGPLQIMVNANGQNVKVFDAQGREIAFQG